MRLCRPACSRIVVGMQAVASAYAARPTGTAPRPALTRDQVMTAAEVVDLLQLPVSTIYYLARRGDLPAARFGRAYRFLRPRIEELLAA